MKRLPTTSRACGSRLFGWSRRVDPNGCVFWHLFRRCSDGKVYGQSFAAAPIDERAEAARGIRNARAQLRWAVDQVEFARLGLQDDTPAPLGLNIHPRQRELMKSDPSWIGRALVPGRGQ